MKVKDFLFGPVPSRRLGFSLGVDIIPRKYCPFDCIYCQVGRTTHRETERARFCDPDWVVHEVIRKIGQGGRIDFVSLSGSGEPTLSSDIGRIIGELKRKTSVPVAVITNGSLLSREEVRRDLALADVVLPSLDAATEEVFEKINRPDPAISLAGLVEGLRAFRREYTGRILLEIMLIKNINTSKKYVEMLKELLHTISVDKVQLNTISRPPLDASAEGVDQGELSSIARFLGEKCEVIAPFRQYAAQPTGKGWRASVLATLKRRSLSFDDIVRVTGVSPAEARAGLERLVREKKIRAVPFDNSIFYVVDEERDSP
jgi:wyosine [tRNA(Phe)-imidazoG37] synthetase (radical SAM superfamily)